MVNEVHQVCNEIQRFVAGSSSSIMRKNVEEKFSSQYSPELVRKSIEYALDNLILQQVVNESPDDPSIQDDMIWCLKAISPSMSEKFKNLLPEDFALIRLLHEQDNPDTRGQMPVSLAKEELQITLPFLPEFL